MNRNATLGKWVKTALLGAVCATPVMNGMTAKAAPQNRDQRSHSATENRRDNSHTDSGQQHTSNQPPSNSHTDSGQQHANNQPRSNSQSHSTNQSGPANQYSDSNRAHSTDQTQNKNWQHRDNNNQNDSWHNSHGYTKSGSTWTWRGHDDGWWFNNGYRWNGASWILQNHDTGNYGPFQTFTGVVTKVQGNHGFNLRVGATTYHIYSTQDLPRSLNVGDVVRAYGQRYGNNVIRNANFSIVSNR